MRHTVVAALIAVFSVGAVDAAPHIAGFDRSAIGEPAGAMLHLAQARRYYTGPRGGCYYINRNGNKTYVDRSVCRR